MSDRDAAEDDPCQGERDLLQALLDSWAELGLLPGRPDTAERLLALREDRWT